MSGPSQPLLEAAPSEERWRRAFGDVVAGLTVGVLVVPQSMAYAGLAGAPPVTGLYSSLVPLLVYAGLGSSRHVGCGPQSLVCLMTGTALRSMDPGLGTAAERLALLCILVGATSCVMAGLRLGHSQAFLSRSLMSAFVSATAVVIAAELLGDIVGVDVPELAYSCQKAVYVARRLDEVKPATAALGLLCMLVTRLVKMAKAACKSPRCDLLSNASTLALFAFAAAWTAACAARGIELKTVGQMPSGLPALTLPAVPAVAALQGLLLPSFGIALVSYAVSMTAGAPFAERARPRYTVHGNQELLALGCANVAGGLFGAYPVSGSLSRSAVNFSSGATSTRSLVVTAFVAACSLLFLAPLFEQLPKCCMAAIIAQSTLELFSFEDFRQAAIVAWDDFVVMLATFFVSVLLGAQAGLCVGVTVSVGALARHAAAPNMVEVGELADGRKGGALVTIDHYPPGEVRPVPGAMCLRMDASPCFANCDALRLFVLDSVAARETRAEELPLRFVVLDMKGANHIDLSGLRALTQLHRELSALGVHLLVGNLKHPFIQVLVAGERSGIEALSLPKEILFIDIHEAMAVVRGEEGALASQAFAAYSERNVPASPTTVAEALRQSCGSPRNSPRSSPRNSPRSAAAARSNAAPVSGTEAP